MGEYDFRARFIDATGGESDWITREAMIAVGNSLPVIDIDTDDFHVSEDRDEEYDLMATNCKIPTHQFSVTCENLWIDQMAVNNPYSYNIMVHTSEAEKRRLQTGDLVTVESKYGKFTGRLKVTELIHPECVGTCGTFGHWAKGLPIAKNKGVLHNSLLPSPRLERIDTLSGQIDQCVKVKIYRAEEQSNA